MTDVLLQPDLSLSFVAALLQYVHELQLSLQNVLLADKSLISVRTLVQSGCTENNIQSLVRSGDTDLHLKSAVFLSIENLHSTRHL